MLSRLWRRLLINEIAANHEARAPEGLARNQLLIRELNDNVAKVMTVANFLILIRISTCSDSAARPEMRLQRRGGGNSGSTFSFSI